MMDMLTMQIYRKNSENDWRIKKFFKIESKHFKIHYFQIYIQISYKLTCNTNDMCQGIILCLTPLNNLVLLMLSNMYLCRTYSRFVSLWKIKTIIFNILDHNPCFVLIHSPYGKIWIVRTNINCFWLNNI